ncbi:MAG: hypothetical protein HUU49_01520 [Candidatus Buchananbacteria bacterium]|nr:hypothetical protein [Candidatus Buchananbacteria bacterium]
MSLSPGTFGAQTRPEEAWLELHRKVSGWLPSEGEQYAELDGDWYGPSNAGSGEPASTKIKQNLITWPGYNYEVSFDFSPRPSTGSGDNILQFNWDGGLIDTLNGAGAGNTNWSSHTYDLTATGFSTELMFADAGTSNSLGTFLDNVSVRCIPPVIPVCGDGEVNNDGEVCDDGNTENGDGCDAQCQPEEIYADYCGDGEVNQEWEQCDGDEGCTQYCQWEEQNECSDLVLARVNVDEVKNWGAGDMSSDVYLGSAGNKIPAGTWFALYYSGAGITDADLSGYENVEGLAVQRLAGTVRAVVHGTGTNNDKEHIHGNIEFYNATVTDQDNDPSNALPGANGLEDGFNGTGTGQYNASNDEVWISDATHSNFWLTTTTADDGFYSDWQIVEDCVGQICGYKYNDKDENGSLSEGDEGLENWTIKLLQFTACEEGDEWADSVVDYTQGTRRNGTPILAERTVTTKALGAAQNNDSINFVSLGFGGELILGFNNLIVNAAGNDVQVVETTYGNQVCNTYPEKADVYASQNGLDWIYLGNACLDSSFDLGTLSWAQYIKFVDATSLADFTNVPEADGYDVDGVKALNCASAVTVVETQMTDETGHYCFETATPGDYRVQEELQSNWHNTSDWFTDVDFNGENSLNVDFFNAVEEQAPQGSICGYKFYDADQDGVFNNNDYGIDGWKIFGLGGSLTSTYTNENGEYCLNALEEGTWNVFEELFTLPGNWATTTVATRTIELSSEGVIGINFGNILCTDADEDGFAANGGAICGEQDCDDNDSEKTTDCSEEEPNDPGPNNPGGGGGGGGGSFSNLVIHTENTGNGPESLTVLITWFTNKPATSRVVYDTVSHPEPGEAPNYGYQWSTPQTDTDPKVTYHEVLISGLDPNTIYYFRPISSASPEVLGTEVSYQILENGEVIVEETTPPANEEPNPGPSAQTPQGEETSAAGGAGNTGIVAGAEFEEPTLLAQGGDAVPTQQPDRNQPQETAPEQTAQVGATDCVMYIWLLLVINIITIADLAYFGMNAANNFAKQLWWMLAILVAVPVILGYAQCWLVVWLLITLVIAIILYFSVIARKQQHS